MLCFRQQGIECQRRLAMARPAGTPHSVLGTLRKATVSMEEEPLREGTMKAVVFHGPGDMSWEKVPLPQIREETDAVIRVDTTTICGTDLHILKGDVPEVTPGTILGHEAVGTVESVGTGVKHVRIGDRVLVSCITSCGICEYCRKGMYGQCSAGGGWILGHTTHGVQAQYARIPLADTSLYRVPEGLTDEQVLMLSDVMPTGYEIGVLSGAVEPGCSVAIVGAGPIGLSALLGARMFSPKRIILIDPDANRLGVATKWGADAVVNNSTHNATDAVMALTDRAGVDVAIEAVGTPATFELATTLVKPGGHIANIGVHGKPATLHLETLWTRNVTITAGLVNTTSTPMLLDLVHSGKLDTSRFVTHRFTMDAFMEAYDVFRNAAGNQALKVVVAREHI